MDVKIFFGDVVGNGPSCATANSGSVGTRWPSRKLAGSIPDGVIGIFHWHNPSGRTMVDSAPNRNEYQEYFLGGGGFKVVGA